MVQTQDNQVRFNRARNPQDLFTVLPKLNHEFWLHRQRCALRNEFVQPLEGFLARFLSHSGDVVRGRRPAETFGNRHNWCNMQQREPGPKMIRKSNRVWQCSKRSRAEICRKQKGTTATRAFKRSVRLRVRPYCQDKPICFAEDLLCNGTQDKLPDAVPPVSSNNH